jgi:hypothetical protein
MGNFHALSFETAEKICSEVRQSPLTTLFQSFWFPLCFFDCSFQVVSRLYRRLTLSRRFQLTLRDLATLPRVCKGLHALATPLLYRTLCFKLPGDISESDPLLRQLETFADLRFCHTQHTTKVVVWGTWYKAYDDLESRLGPEHLLSPAVRMLNALLAVCLSKMPNLESFM